MFVRILHRYCFYIIVFFVFFFSILNEKVFSSPFELLIPHSHCKLFIYFTQLKVVFQFFWFLIYIIKWKLTDIGFRRHFKTDFSFFIHILMECLERNLQNISNWVDLIPSFIFSFSPFATLDCLSHLRFKICVFLLHGIFTPKKQAYRIECGTVGCKLWNIEISLGYMGLSIFLLILKRMWSIISPFFVQLHLAYIVYEWILQPVRLSYDFFFFFW